VRPPAERLQHLHGFLLVARLAVHGPVQDDGGVDAEHEAVAGPPGDGARLPGGMRPHEVDR
jgi:hypothetical protein